jgi:hypothetical protein
MPERVEDRIRREGGTVLSVWTREGSVTWEAEAGGVQERQKGEWGGGKSDMGEGACF